MSGRSLKVVVAVAIMLAVAVPASAGTKGSKSDSASAAWLADGSSFYCDGNKPLYYDSGPSVSHDNFITSDVYVWVLSSNSVSTDLITWVALTGDSDAEFSGDLDYVNSCGLYHLMALDVYDNGGDDGGWLQGQLAGSWSFKFEYSGKNYSADTARFG